MAHRWQTPLTIVLQLAPGGVGLIVGENELFPPGPTAFSVGDIGASLDAEGAVVADSEVAGFVVVGSSLVLVLQPAVSVPITTREAPPATSASRRVREEEFMVCRPSIGPARSAGFSTLSLIPVLRRR